MLGGKRYTDSSKNIMKRDFLYDFALHHHIDWPVNTVWFVIIIYQLYYHLSRDIKSMRTDHQW